MVKSAFVVVGVLSAGLSVSAAQAASVSYSSAPFSGNLSTVTAQVPQFDPSIGTLTGVNIEFTGTFTPIIAVFNFSTTPATVDAFANTTGVNPLGGPPGAPSPLDFNDPYGGASLIDYETVEFGASIAAGPALTSLLQPADIETIPGVASAVPGASWGDFVGLGTTPVDYTVSGSSFIGGSVLSGSTGDIFFGWDGLVEGVVDVTYTYVPTPGAVVLLGLGGLAATRRRRGA